MRCPRDKHQLNRKFSERVFGDCCNQCDGIFLTGKGIQAFEQDIVKQLREHSDQQQPSGDSLLNCPNCETVMNITHVDEIEIDICSACLGVWFDKTEAQAIIQKYDQDSCSQSNIAFAPFPSEFVAMLSKWFLDKPQLESS
jgi:Zn-finger nucleic acid-binding protein